MTNAMIHIGDRNVRWGWAMMFLGALSGSILMAWSFNGPFPAPPGFHDYTELSRRMVRLAHIALFMLPVINIVLGKDLDRLSLGEKYKQLASWGAIIGMVGIPVGLLMGALVHIALKYLAFFPVCTLLGALLIMAFGRFNRPSRVD